MSFILDKETIVSELDSVVRLYHHEPTGARLLSLINKDENKVFGISFRTPPSQSNGVAHIIEHSVLCGSRKYPVKEPFVELIKGSLNTFLNAMTYPDKTCYPVASTNLKDFYNLIDVYLDAVFYPNLTEHTFMQEGWHYEIDPATKRLSYKGVVFNEMKGAYSDPDDLHDDLCRRSLFPDTSYGLDSGGDPLEIPNLRYEDFIDFHKRYYHPSNSFIYFYGDDDPEKRLAILEEWLEPFSAEKIESLPRSQMVFPKPRTIEQAYQASSQDAPKAYSAVNWALYEHGDPELSMKAAVLFHILTGTSASPLRKALIESGLGEDLAGFGVSEELRQAAFSIGLKGVEPARIAEVESLILSTLEKLAKQGIDANAIEASLNTLEFALREKNTGRFPRGLAIMLDALNEWLYDKDPIAGISFAEPLKKVKNEIELHPNLFGELINSLLLGNTHRTTVKLLPSENADRVREESEKDMLVRAATSMSPEDLDRIEAEATILQQRQNTPDSPEALATIPMLSLSDIPKEAPVLPSEPLMLEAFASEEGPSNSTAHDSALSHFPANAFYHNLPTSGIFYLDLGFDSSALPEELLPYMSLLGRFLLEMGTHDMDYVALIQRIGIHTGGIQSTTISTERWDDSTPLSMFFLRAKALPEKALILADILIEVLTKAHFDNIDRVRQIVLEEKAQAESMLIPASTRIVNLRLKSYFSIAGWASEQLYGIEHLLFLRRLAERIEREWPAVLREMETLRSTLIAKENLIINVTADRSTLSATQGAIARIVQSLPIATTSAPPSRNTSWIEAAHAAFASITKRPAFQTIELPTQVNSVGMMLPLPGIKERAGGALVASKYLDVAFLWEHVRVMGGAYGGYSSLDLVSGLFSLLSYRDPNLEKTIGVYKKVAEYLCSIEVAPEEIQKSIIGTIGDIDIYQLPDAKGFNALMNELTGYSQQTRQIIRNQVLTANTSDFHRLGELIESALPHSMIVALTSPHTIENALSVLPAPCVRLSVN